MPIDPSIPLGAQQVNPMQSLSSMLNIANTRQGMQARAIQMQGAQQQNEQGGIDLEERKNLVPLLSDPSKYTGQNGDVDFNKAIPMIMQAAPTTGMNYVHHLLQAQHEKTVAQQTIAQQTDQNNSRAASALGSLSPDSSPEIVSKTLDTVKALYPNQDMQNVIGTLKGHMTSSFQSGDPKMIGNTLKTVSRMFLTPQDQQKMATPGGIQVGNGRVSSVVSTTPGTDVPTGQPIPGTEQIQQLPPQTPTMKGNIPGYLGAQNTPSSDGSPQQDGASGLDTSKLLPQQVAGLARKDPEAFSNGVQDFNRTGQSGFVPSGLPVGQAQNIGDNFDGMNKHFTSLQDQSSGAPLITALTSNIKSLAKSGATGTLSGKISYVSGLLSILHIPSTGDLKTDTDLLEKNMAQLNLGTPANSDAARTIISAARPNSHMSESAIIEASDQLVGQVKANMAMRNVLSNYKQYGDTEGYNAMRQKLEKLADPRIWQYESLPKDQRSEFMTKQKDSKELMNKTIELEKMGVLK